MNRAVWSWRLCAVSIAVIAALGVGGCDEDKTEDCFELRGTLSPATSDTLETTDHLDPVLSPDGTRILFTTDALSEKKTSAARDFAIIDAPLPGEWRSSVRRFIDQGNGLYIELAQVRSDDGTQVFAARESLKGAASWMPDNDSFVGAMENKRFAERLYLIVLGPTELGGDEPRIRADSVTLIDDIGLATLGEAGLRYTYKSPAVSPDGEWVAYTRFYYEEPLNVGDPIIAEYAAIYAYNFSTQQVVRVSNGSSIEQDATWSPDGQWVAFTSNGGRIGSNEIFKVRFDPNDSKDLRQPGDPFTDGRVRLTETTGEDDLLVPVGSFDPSWTSDNRIVYVSTERMPCTSFRIRGLWIMNADGGDPRPLYSSAVDDHFPSAVNYNSMSSDAAGVILFSTRINQFADLHDQKTDIWMLRGY